jgi:hypothetical protein
VGSSLEPHAPNDALSVSHNKHWRVRAENMGRLRMWSLW